MELVRATVNDSKQLWIMQTEAFRDLYEKYQDHDTSPANETQEKMSLRLKQPYTYYYFIKADNHIVGAIRIIDHKDGSPKKVSPVYILKEFRRMGYARKAMLEAEKLHGDCDWELETILQEDGNCHFYESLGYKKTGRTETINNLMTLVYYFKGGRNEEI